MKTILVITGTTLIFTSVIIFGDIGEHISETKITGLLLYAEHVLGWMLLGAAAREEIDD